MSKKDLLNAVAAEVVVCVKCPLWKGRKKAVPGEGSSRAKLFFIGEAPGYWEDVEGRPFVGDAGKFLDSLLSEIGLQREDVFITNVVKCRPPNNRQPRPIEVQTCTPYLERQIGLIQPQFIVTLGSCSTAYIFSKAELPFNGITESRGKIVEASLLGMNIMVLPTFHPAASFHSAKYKKQIVDDFKLLRKELERRGILTASSK